jgi:hypothetical protein
MGKRSGARGEHHAGEMEKNHRKGNYRALPVAGCYLDTGGEIAVLFLNVLAAGRIELEDEAGETGGIAVLFLNVLAGLSGAILTGGGKLVQ